MATAPKPAPKAPAEIGPRQRLNYLQFRIAELQAELGKFQEERKLLRAKLAAERDAKGVGKA